MELFLSITMAVLPSAALLWYFYSHDQRPEPRHILIITFVLGVLVAVPVVGVAFLLRTLYPARLETPMLEALAQAFFYAAIPEEFFKFVVLVGYCTRRKAFDEPMDGVVYGVTASLGFATLENILYVLGGGWPVAIARAITSVPMHAFLGALLGYYVGQAHRHPERLSRLASGLVVVVLLHALYDFPLLTIWEMQMRQLEVSAGLVISMYTMAFSLLAIAGFSTVGIVRRLRREQKNDATEQGGGIP